MTQVNFNNPYIYFTCVVINRSRSLLNFTHLFIYIRLGTSSQNLAKCYLLPAFYRLKVLNHASVHAVFYEFMTIYLRIYKLSYTVLGHYLELPSVRILGTLVYVQFSTRLNYSHANYYNYTTYILNSHFTGSYFLLVLIDDIHQSAVAIWQAFMIELPLKFN